MSTESTKTIKGRIINKHGTEESWILSVYTDLTKTTLRDNPFIPSDGELIIYDPDSIYTYRRIKIGDGKTYVTDLSFVTDPYQAKTDNILETDSKEIVGAINEVNEKIATGGTSGLEIVTTTGTGDAYEATVKGITELKAGVSFVMIPHVESNTSGPSLNVNGLGAKGIRRGSDIFTSVGVAGNNSQWLRPDYPCRVMYNGQYWIAADMAKPSASDLNGIVPVDKGGVPTTSADNVGKVLTTNSNGIPTWKEPASVGVDKIAELYTSEGYTEHIDTNGGIGWKQTFGFYSEDGEPISEGTIYQYLPIIAGGNVNFEIDEENELVKINATGDGVGADKVKSIDTWANGVSSLQIDDGIYWEEGFTFYDENGLSGNTITNGTISHRIPLSAGENATFIIDEENQVVKINTTSDTPQTSITYSELKTLRDNSELIPGMFYRITDYQCTTTQENTRAMDNQFDIIVQALSSNTLSENASADYHYQNVHSGALTISSSVIESEGVLVEGSVTPYYYEYIDFEDSGDEGLHEYKTMDIFIAYDYLENNESVIVPVLYKTNEEGLGDDPNPEFSEPDYQDAFYYVGTADVDGTTYDKWKKINIDDGLTWDSEGQIYLYTNIIVQGGSSSNYFVNSNLAAWELKYSLDNDTTRFAWADTENGKGVIYWMKDENNNECPYDFKNIQFKRYMITETLVDSISDLVGHYFGTLYGSNYTVDESDYIWCYTFSWLDENDKVEDLSIVGQRFPNDEGQYSGVYSNVINTVSACNKLSPDNPEYYGIALNDIVCLSEWDYEYGRFYGCYSNTFGSDCYSNTFGNECSHNTFGNNYSSNTFGHSCYSNTFGNECYSNTFGNECSHNTFGNECSRNIFGHGFYSNTFGYGCYSNTFGNECSDNTFGSDCYSNTFGNVCSHNTFVNNCRDNTFGNNCYYNTFGNKCYHNTFGDGCEYNTFSSDTVYSEIINFAKYISFANGCSYIKLITMEIGDSSNYVQDITVSAGVRGTHSNYRELQVSRNASPVVYEAANTTHIILD